MFPKAPLALRHGPLTVYLKSLNGCVDCASFTARLAPDTPVVWLDSARQHPVTGRWSLVGFDPWLTFIAHGDRLELRTSAATRVWRGQPLEALRGVLARYRASAASAAHLRAVGLVGWLSYDLNRWIERLPPPQPTERACPEMVWCGMRRSILVDHLQRRTWLVSVADPHAPSAWASRQAREALEQLDARVTSSRKSAQASHSGVIDAPIALEATSTRTEFEQMVSQALEYIRAGEVFRPMWRSVLPRHGGARHGRSITRCGRSTRRRFRVLPPGRTSAS